MNRKTIVIIICIISLIVIFLTTISFGPQGTYVSCGGTYNKFLFIPAKNANFTIHFRKPYSGALTLIDEKGKPLSNKDFTIYIDNKKSGATFNGNGTRSLNVSIRCSTNLSAGKKYIRVQGGGPLVTHVYFTHYMNPLLYALVYLLFFLSIFFLIWFLIIKKLKYPIFKTSIKQFFIPGHAPIIIKPKGMRMVVISNSVKRQSLFEEILKGPILYINCPVFKTPLILLPNKRGILVKPNQDYKVNTNPIPYIGTSQLTIINEDIKITIN